MRRNKYGAKKTLIDNITFDSLLEARRYQELRLLERAGLIRGLRVHTRWPLSVNEHRLGHYVSDFDYFENDELIIEDTKGRDTRLSAWKRKHMFAQKGIAVRLVKKAIGHDPTSDMCGCELCAGRADRGEFGQYP